MEEVKSSPAPPVVTNRLPTLGLRDLVFFPAMVLPLLVGRARSVAALEEATEAGAGGYLLLLAQRDADSDEPSAADLHRVGTVTRVVQSTRLADGTFRVVFEGIERVRVKRFLPGPGPFRSEVVPLTYPDLKEETASAGFSAIVRRAERGFRDYVHSHPDLPLTSPPTCRRSNLQSGSPTWLGAIFLSASKKSRRCSRLTLLKPYSAVCSRSSTGNSKFSRSKTTSIGKCG